MKTVGERLRYARNMRGFSQEQLHDISGVKQGTISKLERGDSKRSTFIPQLAHALDCSPMWIAEGIGNPPTEIPVGESRNEFGYIDTPDGTMVTDSVLVPLISWVQAGDFEEMSTPYEWDSAEKWVRCPEDNYDTHTYALRVQGRSMEPEFNDGDVIFIDPGKVSHARNGSYVIVRMDDENTATFKELVIEGDRKYLKPLNPLWPSSVIEVNGNATIIGVVISRVKSYTL